MKKILLGAVVVVGGFLLYVALQPSNMYVFRELTVKSSPEKIFPYLNNSQKLNEWMPWSETDPHLVMKYAGPEEGVGAMSTWDSQGQMGAGQAEIVESIPQQKVTTQLTYTRPMAMSQVAEMTLTSSQEGTVVRWSVSGQNTFIGRLFCVFMDMDKVVGGSFEKGLTKLKSIVEKESGRGL